jgi:hypothetical protein
MLLAGHMHLSCIYCSTVLAGTPACPHAHLLVVLIICQVKPPGAVAGINEAAVAGLGDALQDSRQYIQGKSQSHHDLQT